MILVYTLSVGVAQNPTSLIGPRPDRRWVARKPRSTAYVVKPPAEPAAAAVTAAPAAHPKRSSPHFLQQLRAAMKPANSGRNQFARMWKKQRQIAVRRAYLWFSGAVQVAGCRARPAHRFLMRINLRQIAEEPPIYGYLVPIG